MGATVPRLAVLCCLLGAEPASAPEDSEPADHERWRRTFDDVAAEYRLHRLPASPDLELLDRRTYNWARSGPHGGNFGTVYVWTDRGTAAAVGCLWRYVSADGTPAVVHELHSLSPSVLVSDEGPGRSWKPKAGVKRQPLTDAPVQASTPAGRLLQMRAIGRDFSARSISAHDERTELRLLPQPLYRYQSADPAVIDGGLFAFVCSVGTDPEAFLLLEAVDTAAGPRWQYALARFSHFSLYADYKGREVWQAVRDAENPIAYNADRTYWVFHSAVDPSLLAPPVAGR